MESNREQLAAIGGGLEEQEEVKRDRKRCGGTRRGGEG